MLGERAMVVTHIFLFAPPTERQLELVFVRQPWQAQCRRNCISVPVNHPSAFVVVLSPDASMFSPHTARCSSLNQNATCQKQLCQCNVIVQCYCLHGDPGTGDRKGFHCWFLVPLLVGSCWSWVLVRMSHGKKYVSWQCTSQTQKAYAEQQCLLSKTSPTYICKHFLMRFDAADTRLGKW